MKTGIIVLGQHSASAGEKSVAERCADYLRKNGRKDVHIAFHYGDPSSDEVMESMNLKGTDTFVILPLAVSEGQMTVWSMPKKLGLPDNCGSWRMMNGKDVATRFATALGKNYALADELVAIEGPVDERTALLFISYGSRNKDCEDTARFYSEKLGEKGWKTDVAFCRFGRTVGEAVTSLKSEGIDRIRVIPLFIAFDGPAAIRTRHDLESYNIDIQYRGPISELDSFYKIIDSKVPEGW